MNEKIETLRALEAQGIIEEWVPTPKFWVFAVRKPDQLPLEFAGEYAANGELRWYGD